MKKSLNKEAICGFISKRFTGEIICEPPLVTANSKGGTSYFAYDTSLLVSDPKINTLFDISAKDLSREQVKKVINSLELDLGLW